MSQDNLNALVLADNPLGFWKLDDTGGTATDSSGNALHGTYQTGTVGGQIDADITCAEFNGSSTGVSLPAISGDWATNGWSMFALVRRDADVRFGKILALSSGTNSYITFSVGENDAQDNLNFQITGNVSAADPAQMPIGDWVFVGVTHHSDGTIQMWADGVEVYDSTHSLPANGSRADADIGYNTAWNDGSWDGGIASVALFDKHISAARVGEYWAAMQQSGVIIPAASGSFAFSGSVAQLLKTSKLNAASGAFAFSGHPASLLKSSRLHAESGVFAFTGHDVGFIYSGAAPVNRDTWRTELAINRRTLKNLAITTTRPFTLEL